MGAGERREEAARATEAEYTLTKGLVRPGLGYLNSVEKVMFTHSVPNETEFSLDCMNQNLMNPLIFH